MNELAVLWLSIIEQNYINPLSCKDLSMFAFNIEKQKKVECVFCVSDEKEAFRQRWKEKIVVWIKSCETAMNRL